MSLGYLHLVLTHLPVVGVIFGVALFGAALWKKSEELQKVSFWSFIAVALLAIAATLTGEPAEHMVQGIPEVSKAVITPHEQMAHIALLGALMVGCVAALGLFLSRKQSAVPAALTAAVLVLSLGTTAIMLRTANLGGKIRHAEIRGGAHIQAPPVPPQNHDSEHGDEWDSHQDGLVRGEFNEAFDHRR